MTELVYSRKSIVRTVATGFVIGGLILSIGGVVVLTGLALFGAQPFALKRVLTTIALLPVGLLFYGILLGGVVRLGPGVHAYWNYRRNPWTLPMRMPGESFER